MKSREVSIKKFQHTIWKYFEKNRRDFSWRPPTLTLNQGIARKPYQVLVSEIMLQQTQVSRVSQKYPIFLKHFPDFPTLAKASLSDVLKVWQGMGYNRRAKYLKELARIVVEKYGGILPEDIEKLVLLPGIGKGTAGAVAAFAFNKPVSFIETNIRRVYIHFFFPKKKKISDKDILVLIENTVDHNNPREWYYALMDYGAMLGALVKNPNRQSKIYKKQSPFKGSLREIRGHIVKEASKNKTVKIEDLKAVFQKRNSDLIAAIDGLKREGFIKEKKGILSIA